MFALTKKSRQERQEREKTIAALRGRVRNAESVMEHDPYGPWRMAFLYFGDERMGPLSSKAAGIEDVAELEELAITTEATAAKVERERQERRDVRWRDLRGDLEAVAADVRSALEPGSATTGDDLDALLLRVQELARTVARHQSDGGSAQDHATLSAIDAGIMEVAGPLNARLGEPAFRHHHQRKLADALEVFSTITNPDARARLLEQVLTHQGVASVKNADGRLLHLKVRDDLDLYWVPLALVDAVKATDAAEVVDPTALGDSVLDAVEALYGTDAYQDLVNTLAAACAL